MKLPRFNLPPMKLAAPQVNRDGFPRDFRATSCRAMSFSPKAGGIGCGVEFHFAWASSTGSLDDLNAVQCMEKVVYIAASGTFAGAQAFNSGWRPAFSGADSDEHFTAEQFLKAGDGTSEAHQLFIYKSGGRELVAPRSGFKVTRTLATLGGNKYRMTTTKVGARVTIDQYTTEAGQCTKAEVVQLYENGSITIEGIAFLS